MFQNTLCTNRVNSIIEATLLLTFTFNYGQNLLVWVRIGNMIKVKNRVKIPNVRIGLRSNHIFELNSMIGVTLLLTFTLNYG